MARTTVAELDQRMERLENALGTIAENQAGLTQAIAGSVAVKAAAAQVSEPESTIVKEIVRYTGERVIQDKRGRNKVLGEGFAFAVVVVDTKTNERLKYPLFLRDDEELARFLESGARHLQ